MTKTHEMKGVLSFFGLSRSVSSSSGKSMDELDQKSRENPKNMNSTEWKDLLDVQTYHVTRENGTERPWSSCLNEEKRKGTFICSCCKQPLFQSTTKFESGSGWPSFWDPIKNADGSESVKYLSDKSLFMVRVEVLCNNCDAHLGHVFDDGPPPTGKRYCMNGVSLNFIAEESK